MLRKILTFGFVLFVLLIVLDLSLGFVGRMIFEVRQAPPIVAAEYLRVYNSLPPKSSRQWPGPDGEFELSTNQYGMRMGPVSIEKEPATLRIAVLGDAASLAFGLPRQAGYAAWLSDILNQKGADSTRYEVLNFSGISTSTYQARQQYKQLVDHFNADLLLLALGRYDAMESRLSDAEYFERLNQFGLTGFEDTWLAKYSLFSSAAYWLLQNQLEKRRQRFEQSLLRLQNQAWKRRVPKDNYIQNLQEIIQHHRGRGGQAVLAQLNLLNDHYCPALTQLAASLNTPFVNFRIFFKQTGGRNERRLAIKKQLARAGSAPGTGVWLLFRVYAAQPEPKPIWLWGEHPALQSPLPLNDEGAQGDERAGDSVWSLAVELEASTSFAFTFLQEKPADLDEASQNPLHRDWKNRLVYYRFVPPALPGGYVWHSPVYRFGKPTFDHLVLRGDPALPNRLGHRAIAQRLAGVIENLSTNTQMAPLRME